MEEAVHMYTRAMQLKPTFADAYSNLAATYKDMGRLNEAIFFYEKALTLKPWFPDAFCNLLHAKTMVADWTTREEDMKTLMEMMEAQMQQGQCPSVQPFHFFVYPVPLDKVLEITIRYAEKRTTLTNASLPPAPEVPRCACTWSVALLMPTLTLPWTRPWTQLRTGLQRWQQRAGPQRWQRRAGPQRWRRWWR